MPSYKLYVFRKMWDFNENVCRTTIQLLHFDINVTLHNFEK